MRDGKAGQIQKLVFARCRISSTLPTFNRRWRGSGEGHSRQLRLPPGHAVL